MPVFNEDAANSVALTSASVVIPYRRPLYLKDGKRIARLPSGEFILGTPASAGVSGSSSGFLAVSLTDLADGTYYFYAGLTESGAWQVNRYPKSNLINKSVALVGGNASYLTLSDAWAARGSLVYV